MKSLGGGQGEGRGEDRGEGREMGRGEDEQNVRRKEKKTRGMEVKKNVRRIGGKLQYKNQKRERDSNVTRHVGRKR